MKTIWQMMVRAMRKLMGAQFETRRLEYCIMSHQSQCHDNAWLGYCFQLLSKILVTGVDLTANRFVLWWQALDGIGYPAIPKPQAVASRY